MRATAHVDVFFVVVQTHGLLVRHVFNQTQLVLFTTSGEDINNFSAWRHFLNDVVVLLDQLLHALLDCSHII